MFLLLVFLVGNLMTKKNSLAISLFISWRFTGRVVDITSALEVGDQDSSIRLQFLVLLQFLLFLPTPESLPWTTR